MPRRRQAFRDRAVRRRTVASAAMWRQPARTAHRGAYRARSSQRFPREITGQYLSPRLPERSGFPLRVYAASTCRKELHKFRRRRAAWQAPQTMSIETRALPEKRTHPLFPSPRYVSPGWECSDRHSERLFSTWAAAARSGRRSAQTPSSSTPVIAQRPNTPCPGSFVGGLGRRMSDTTPTTGS